MIRAASAGSFAVASTSLANVLSSAVSSAWVISSRSILSTSCPVFVALP